MNTATMYAAFWNLGISPSVAAKAVEDTVKREERYRNRQNNGKTMYQPVSHAGKEFYNLRQMYAEFDA